MPPTSPPPPPAPPTEHTWNSLYFPPIEIPPVILYRPIQPRFELVLTPPTELVFQFYLFSPFPAFSAGIPDAIWVFVPHLLLFLPLILFNSSRYAPGGLHGTWRKSKFFFVVGWSGVRHCSYLRLMVVERHPHLLTEVNSPFVLDARRYSTFRTSIAVLFARVKECCFGPSDRICRTFVISLFCIRGKNTVFDEINRIQDRTGFASFVLKWPHFFSTPVVFVYFETCRYLI